MARLWVAYSDEDVSSFDVRIDDLEITISELKGFICDEQRRRNLPIGVARVFDEFGEKLRVDIILKTILQNGYGSNPTNAIIFESLDVSVTTDAERKRQADRLERLLDRAEQLFPHSRPSSASHTSSKP